MLWRVQNVLCLFGRIVVYTKIKAAVTLPIFEGVLQLEADESFGEAFVERVTQWLTRLACEIEPRATVGNDGSAFHVTVRHMYGAVGENPHTRSLCEQGLSGRWHNGVRFVACSMLSRPSTFGKAADGATKTLVTTLRGSCTYSSHIHSIETCPAQCRGIHFKCSCCTLKAGAISTLTT